MVNVVNIKGTIIKNIEELPSMQNGVKFETTVKYESIPRPMH